VKKVLLIGILFAYSIASFGVSLNYFYCCGKLKSISLFAKTNENNCKGKSKKSCCNNKVVTLQLKIDQKDNNKESSKLYTSLSPAIPNFSSYTHHYFVQSFEHKTNYVNPPPGYLPSRQILYCIFRI
jgi:hypothetical protein